jgi:hypothetical protein
VTTGHVIVWTATFPSKEELSWLECSAAGTVSIALSACGSSGSSAGPSGGGSETRTFTGTTWANSATSCGGDSHDFQAGDGTVTLTLVQTTGNVGLSAQVCAGGIDDRNCTINQGPIAVSQTLSGVRKGGTSQNLKLLPANCGGGGPQPPGPVDYTATVTYPRP